MRLALALACIATPACASVCNIAPTTITHTPGFVAQAPTTYVLDRALYPRALCNDGSPGAYALRPGFGEGAHRWVIYLHGGGSCVDQAACSSRYGTSQSSSLYLSHTNGVPFSDGLGSADPAQNPDFYDANAVPILYCSSDSWSGGTDGDPSYPATDVRSWHFQGRAIVRAVIRDLVKSHGLRGTDEVLVAGGSSGALGVFENANDVLASLPKGTRALFLPDAGYAINAQGFDPNEPNGVSPASTTPSQVQIAQGNALWKGRGDKNCTAAARNHNDVLACYSPEVLAQGGWMPPMMVNQSQYDEEQISEDGLPRADMSTPIGEAYMYQYFGPLMNASLAATAPDVAVYSAWNGQHVLASTTQFATEANTFGGKAITLAQALGTWYRAPCGTRQAMWEQEVGQ